jgi:hypothetical protein
MTRELGAEAASPASDAKEGEPGAEVPIDELLTASITSGLATAFVGVLNAWVSPESSVLIHIKSADVLTVVK